MFPVEPDVKSCGVAVGCKPGGSRTAFPRQSTADGEAVVYEGDAFAPGEGALKGNEYVARRSAEEGWQSTNLSPLALNSNLYGGYRAFSPDLTRGALIQSRPAPALVPQAPPGYRDLYAQGAADPSSLQSLLSAPAPHRSTSEFNLLYAGGSEDLSRVFFSANDTLTGPTPYAPEPLDGGNAKRNLYEWQPADGQLALVNVMPGNAVSEPGASFGAERATAHAISADGSRAFWEDEAGQLYVREDGVRTRLVSESQRGIPDPSGPQPAHFLAASPDGSRALFSSHQELTDDADTGPLRQLLHVEATAGTFSLSFEGDSTGALLYNASPAEIQAALEALPGIGSGNVVVTGAGGYSGFNSNIAFAGALAGNETELIGAEGSGLTGSLSISLTSRSGSELYEWREGTLTDLTEGQGGFEALAGHSEDLSHVYFTDSAALTGGEENEAGEVAQEGRRNLYSWTPGEGTGFVATLEASVQERVRGRSEASPGGRFLAFQSELPLTGYDNTGPCGYVAPTPTVPAHYEEGPCPEVFLYDSATGMLRCPSCDASGARPLGWSYLRRSSSVYDARYLLDSGRLYFDSEDSLVPADTNEGVEDVYQYEPDGTGSCASAEGCTRLISAGTGTVDSNFVAVNEGTATVPGGADVFFTTRDRLRPKDTDELIDLYDAREGGGVAAETETQRAECQGEACQPSPAPPGGTTPASAAFHGAGNLAPTGGGSNRCAGPARRAQKLSRRAKGLRLEAHRVARRDAKKARRLRRRAARLARQARRQSRQARRCRARIRKTRRAHR